MRDASRSGGPPHCFGVLILTYTSGILTIISVQEGGGLKIVNEISSQGDQDWISKSFFLIKGNT